MLTLRIFVASPGDVTEERRLALQTIRELESGHLLRGRVTLQVVAWDDPSARIPLDGRSTPQRSVQRYAGRPADCDLTLVVLWGRLGTLLPEGLARADGSRFPSGTVWEVEDALAADRPVFIYRRTEKPRIELDDPAFDARRAQFDALSRWFAGFERSEDGSLRAGVNDYATPAEFRDLLRQHLEAFISDRLQEGVAASAPAAEPAARRRVPVPEPGSSPAAAAGSRRSRSAFAAAVAVGTTVAAALVWWLWPAGADRPAGPLPTAPVADVGSMPGPTTLAKPASPAEVPSSALAVPTRAVPTVQLPDDPVVTGASKYSPATYTVLSASAAPGLVGHWRLTLRLRMAVPDNGVDVNFMDSAFRVLQDGVPRAPGTVLIQTVQRGTAKEAALDFDVPHGTQTLALRVWHNDVPADVPLQLTGAGAPAPPFAFPPGPRRVVVDGPAEVGFTKGSRVVYALLAAGTEARRPGVLGLRLRLRMTVVDSGGGDNFWDSSFRLVVDGQPQAPDSNLNELVAARAAGDGEIRFEIPETARSLVLRIRRSDTETAELPLRLEAGR